MWEKLNFGLTMGRRFMWEVVLEITLRAMADRANGDHGR